MNRISGTSRNRRTLISVWAMTLIPAIGLGMGMVTITGCHAIHRQMDGVDMSQRIKHAPPIRLGTLDDKHLLIMQAPNPGWSFTIDRTEIAQHGMKVFITIRRPDPAYMHPQVIVEKQLLTDVRAQVPITLMARLLDAHETTKDRPHTSFEPVERFQD